MFGVPLLSQMFFPAIVYHFGVGERRFTRWKALYGLLFGAIILGIVINVASGYIASHFIFSRPVSVSVHPLRRLVTGPGRRVARVEQRVIGGAGRG